MTVFPAQTSTLDQLRELVQLANREGLYDAADWLLSHIKSMRSSKSEGTMKKPTLKEAVGMNEGRIAIYAPEHDAVTLDYHEAGLTLDKNEWRYFSREMADFADGFVLVDEDGDVWFNTGDGETVEATW